MLPVRYPYREENSLTVEVLLLFPCSMLSTTPIIGFIPTLDADRSRAFYQHALGLTFVADDGFALVFESGKSMIRIARVQELLPPPYTILGWEVSDIVAEASALIAKGVVFVRYPFLPPNQVDALGIWSAPGGAKVAWFQDPDGNTLSLSQHVS